MVFFIFNTPKLEIASDITEKMANIRTCSLIWSNIRTHCKNYNENYLLISKDVASSYFDAAKNALELEQYQISLKMFLKAKGIEYKMNFIMNHQEYKQNIAKCKQEIKNKICNYCGRGQEAKKLNSCKGCALTMYCSTKCQKMDWKNNNHREFCSKYWIKKYYLVKQIW